MTTQTNTSENFDPSEDYAAPCNVVTYRLAYVPGEVALCAECEASDAAREAYGVLGAVSHGSHLGQCQGPAHK